MSSVARKNANRIVQISYNVSDNYIKFLTKLILNCIIKAYLITYLSPAKLNFMFLLFNVEYIEIRGNRFRIFTL